MGLIEDTIAAKNAGMTYGEYMNRKPRPVYSVTVSAKNDGITHGQHMDPKNIYGILAHGKRRVCEICGRELAGRQRKYCSRCTSYLHR